MRLHTVLDPQIAHAPSESASTCARTGSPASPIRAPGSGVAFAPHHLVEAALRPDALTFTGVLVKPQQDDRASEGLHAAIVEGRLTH